MPQADFPRRLSETLYFALDCANSKVYELVADGLKELGILPRHFAVLSALTELGPTSQFELGTRIGVNRNAMVQLCDQLEELDLAVREVNPENRRAHIVTITEHGKKVLKAAVKQVNRTQEKCLSDLNESERRSLINLLGRVQCKPD